MTPTANGQWVDFDVSTYVQQAQASGSGLISFGFSSAATTGTGVNYASKEHAYAPQLLLTVGAPTAPLNLTATAGVRKVSLGWNGVRGATSYSVYEGVATGQESATAIATGLTSPGYIASPRNPGPYFYQVTAFNANGESIRSNEASATVVNQAPTVATAAAASPNPVTGTTTALSVLGADDGGEANLIYAWATTGTPPAAVTFSANVTNAAKNATATFTKAGVYTIRATIKDGGGLTATSDVTVTVNQTLTTISVTPPSVALHLNGAQAFTASGKDQFGTALTAQPTFTWSVDAGGVGSFAGATYNAGSVAGTATARATSAAVSGTSAVTVTNAAPTVATAAAAAPNPVTGTTTALSVLGADDGGAANLTYTWAATGTPPAAVTFSPNGTNAAKSSTATFTKAGSYTLQATIKDSGNLTTTSSVVVTVNQTLTTISVTPLSATVVVSGTQQFAASALDQFAAALASQPTFTWTAGGGTITSAGLYTAGGTAGGPFPVTAASGGKTGNASVTVGAVPDFTLTAAQYNLTIPAGSSLADAISISKFNGFSGPVTFSTPSPPTGVTAAYSAPNPTTAVSSTLTLSVAAGTAATTSPLPITVQGVSGGLTHTAVVYLTITATPSGAPMSLAASPGSSRVSLTWGACAGATTYTLYRSNSTGTETSYKTGLTTTSYIDTGLTNGTRYYYFVTATYSGTESAHSNEAEATPQGIANGLAIDSGDLTPPEYVDTGLGHHTWALDEAYSGGSVISVGTGVTIAGTSDPTLYRTQRVGSTFSYTIPVNNGGYQVSLYFAEIEGKTAGQRVFGVALNGSQMLSGYDIAATSGANTAAIKSYPVNVTNGSLNIAFSATSGSAAVGAILITPQIGSVIVDNPPPGWADGVVPTTAATGVAEEDAGPDLEVYNPIGPDVSYSRFYRNSRPGFAAGYGSPGLSPGWTDNYDLTATDDGTGTLTLHYTNGGKDVWTNNSGVLSVASNVPYTVAGTRSGSTWTNLAMLLPDSSQYQFSLINGSTTTYGLRKMVNVLGQGVTINRDASNRLLTIDNDAATHLLQFAYSGASLSTVTDATDAGQPRQVTYTFGANGLSGVSQINQPSLPAWQYGYDLFNTVPYLTSVLEPNPVGSGMSQSTILYDGAGHVLETFDPVGRRMFLLHGTANTLIQAYDASDNLAVQWFQNFTSAGYDAGFTDGLSHTETVQYTDPNNPTCPTLDTNRNGSGRTSTMAYDTLGRMQSATNPFGISVNLGYTTPTAAFPKGLLSTMQVKNAANATLPGVSCTYYPATNTATGAIAGYVQTETTPKPGVPGSTVTTTYTYTANGNIKRIVGPGNNAALAGIQVDYDYINGHGFTTTEKLGQPVTVTVSGIGTSDTTSTYYKYDPHGNVIQETDALGNTTDAVYNVFDQVTDTYDPPSDPTQPTKRVHTVTTYRYNDGPVATISVYEEDGTTLKQQVTYNYNSAGEVTSVVDLNGTVVAYAYDGAGRVSAMADGVGGAHVTQYFYDAADNLSTVLYPGNPTGGSIADKTVYQYDWDGNVVARFDGNADVSGHGVETDYVRDHTKDDRVTNIQYPSFPALNVGYDYDAFDRMTSVSNAGATKSYILDDIGLVTQATTTYAGLPALPISYSYWPDGSRQTMTVPLVGASGASANYSYLYDGVGRLTQVKFPWTGSSYTYSYENNGWLKRTQGPRTRTLYGYNGRGLLTSLRNYSSPNNQLLSSFTGMTYDAVGDRLKQNSFVASQGMAPDMSRSLTYTYDPRGQLLEDKSVKSSGAYTGATYDYTYGYDLAGNQTTFRGASVGFNANNQFGDTSQFIYDGNGNPTTYNGSAFSFDQENRLTGASGAASLSSWYDPDGLRGWKNAGGATAKTYFLYDGDTPVLEVQPSGSTWVPMAANGEGADGIRSRYYPPTSPLALAGYGSQDYSYTFDPQGNLVQRHLSNAGNTDAMDTVLYDGYGMQIADVDAITGSAEAPPGGGAFFDPVGFGGQWGYYGDKETGFQLLTHRYYDSGHGRFVNRDPIGYLGGINVYGYASNNPIRNIDPTGYQNATNFGSAYAWDKAASQAALDGIPYHKTYDALWQQSKKHQADGRKQAERAFLALSLIDGAGEVYAAGRLTLGVSKALARKLIARAALKEAAEVGAKDGADRAATWGALWQKASLNDTISRICGPNATSWITKSGKLIYENPKNYTQVVYDIKGNYFRVFKPKSVGSADGRYLDQWGNVPTEFRQVSNGEWRNVEIADKAYYRQVTHYVPR